MRLWSVQDYSEMSFDLYTSKKKALLAIFNRFGEVKFDGTIFYPSISEDNYPEPLGYMRQELVK